MISVLVLMVRVSAGYGAEKPVLAVMEIEDRSGRFGEEPLASATDYLRAALVATHYFLVVDRGRQEEKRTALLNQLKRESHDPCYDDQCKIELGRNLAADTLLTCRITALGKTCAFSCELVPLDRAVTEAGGLDRFDCSEEGLAGSVDAVVAQVAGQTASGKKDRDQEQLFSATVPPDDAPMPRMPVEARSPREQYLTAGFEPDKVGDFLGSGLSLHGWRQYREGRISGWNMAWCSFLPGACMYCLALNGGSTFQLLRGLLYTGAWVALAGSTSSSSGDSSPIVGSQEDGRPAWAGTALAMTYIAHIIDGGVSIYVHNRELRTDLEEKYPLHPEPRAPGVGPPGLIR